MLWLTMLINLRLLIGPFLVGIALVVLSLGVDLSNGEALNLFSFLIRRMQLKQ